MRLKPIIPLLLLALMLGSAHSLAGWRDFLGEITGQDGPLQSGPSDSLSQQEIAAGLRQALNQGIRNSVQSLGRQGGFLDNPQVRIPMPDRLQAVEKVARSLGQDELADRFVVSMNRAAEKAVPATMDILTKAVSQMSLSDVHTILEGPSDAATRYFERTARSDLTRRIEPIVSDAIDSVGVTSLYQELIQMADPLTSMLGDQATLDVNDYVTQETLDGLFLFMAEEEQRIRENPAARTTELLRKVFGAL